MPFKVGPITSEPRKGEFITPTGQGLSCLSSLEKFQISQSQVQESCCEIKHYFRIEDSEGMRLLKGELEIHGCKCQDSDIVLREVPTQVELFRIRKHGECCAGCGGSSLEVMTPDGELVGSVEEKWNFCMMKFLLKDGQGEHVLWIKGSSGCCGASHNYKILSADRLTQVGEIEKQIMLFGSELEASLSIDMDVRQKMISISTILFMNYLYFRQQQARQRRGR